MQGRKSGSSDIFLLFLPLGYSAEKKFWLKDNIKKESLNIYVRAFIDFREVGRERVWEIETSRETSIDCLLHNPSWGWRQKPEQVPRQGIKLVTPWLIGQYSTTELPQLGKREF